MDLIELQPRFIKRISDDRFQEVEKISEADGVQFLCPKCFIEKKGPIGTHAIVCWNPSVPQSTSPSPGRWNMLGTDFADLELKAGSSSVSIEKGCKAHFYVRNGKIIPC